MIRLQTYNRNELSEFINAPAFPELPFLPISYHRAISHIHNPRADAGDVLLIQAFDENNPVGYLGILPDWIHDDHGNRNKCGWLSCMWIDPACRGKGISKKLVAMALESWQQKILVTEFTVAAKGLYDKTGAFKDLQIKEGLRLYIRSDLARLLPPKGGYLETLKPLWSLLDSVFNAIFDARLFIQSNKKKNTWQYVSEIDREINSFIQMRQQSQIFKRDQLELNWMMHYPWILTGKPDILSEKYYFSSVADIFEFVPVKLKDPNNQMIAFLLFARRDQSLKIPYCYFESTGLEQVIDCIRWHLKYWRIKTCTFFHPDLVEAFKENKSPALFARPIKRHYIISKVFEQFSPEVNYEIQDGDADCAFT